MSPAPVNLSAAKARRLASALEPLVLVYEGVTAVDVLVLMQVAQNPGTRPTEIADAVGLQLTRTMKVIYSLERGRTDEDKKALGLLEVRANTTPGQRNSRMVFLTPKGEKTVRAMLDAFGG